MADAASDGDSDYGWDLALDEDVHQLLNATLPATAISVATPLSPSAKLLTPAALGDALDHADSIPHSLGLAAARKSDVVADDDDPSAAAVLDAAVLGEVAYPDCMFPKGKRQPMPWATTRLTNNSG